jgi:carboxymethylenebutenolidase
MKRLIIALVVSLATQACAQDWARSRVESTPRHLEWTTVKHDGRELGCYVGYPEVKDKATAVIVIHEIYGHSDWVRSMVDELAEAGYIAIAPDLLWGLGAKGGGTAELSSDQIGQKIRGLPEDQITADLKAVKDYVTKLPACNGKVAVIGFCWGGTQSFRFATHDADLKAAFVCYGSAPTDSAELARIKAPVYGFYAGNDARVTATVAPTTEAMKSAGKTYEPVVYEGAGHGFMRAGEDPKNAGTPNKKARDAAWKRITEVLKTL